MKIFLGMLCVLYTSLSFANIENINEKQLVGGWSCISAFTTDTLKIVEVSDAFINVDGSLSQNGNVYYKDHHDEATLKYEMVSNWQISNNKIKFSNLKFNKFYMKNQDFNKRYDITNALLKLENKEDYYTILKLTASELLMSQAGSNVQENCKKI